MSLTVGSAPSGFEPPDLPNLHYWFDSIGIRIGVIIPSDFEWDDQQNLPAMLTGNLIDVTPPPPVVNGLTTLNGHDALSLQAGFGLQNGGYTVGGGMPASYTVAGIITIEDAVIVNNRVYWQIQAAGNAQSEFMSLTNAGTPFLRMISPNAQQCSVTHPVSKTGAGWFIYVGTVNSANKTVQLHIDGVTTSNQNLAQNNYIAGNSLAAINITGAVPQLPVIGNMGEFLFYSDVKNNADINSIGSYFANKYGLVWTSI